MPKAKYDGAENKIETIELERLESKATRVWLLLPHFLIVIKMVEIVKNARWFQKVAGHHHQYHPWLRG